MKRGLTLTVVLILAAAMFASFASDSYSTGKFVRSSQDPSSITGTVLKPYNGEYVLIKHDGSGYHTNKYIKIIASKDLDPKYKVNIRNTKEGDNIEAAGYFTKYGGDTFEATLGYIIVNDQGKSPLELRRGIYY